MTIAMLLTAALPVAALALISARREYRRRGRLSWFGLSLLIAMLFIPNLALDYATTYEWPRSATDYAGIAVGTAGIVLLVFSLSAFRSMTKMLCLDQGELTICGPYRFSRNPQYVGYFLFLAGYAMNDWSLWCLAVLAIVAVSLHLLVLIEEEHLKRVFGDEYAEFLRRVPRYFGRPVNRSERDRF
ncbi:MAG: isoprenylcysteine carboxylmethyltransferase family protein [Woeseiaceae bacterium]|nr:isoprenylcysteine carboxylmethyltransferase family protein [Woeseiaceae bacterium]